MEVSDRCLLRNQYTYPNSYQYLSTVPVRPFQVHRDELEKCVCETHSTGRKCPYHEALKVAPEERSGAMKAVVESHDLAIEAGQLLLTTRAQTQHEDFDRLVRLRGAVEASEEGAVLEKGAAKLIKAALLHRGISMHVPLAPLSEFSIRLAYSGLAEGFGPCLGGETAEQRARRLSWLHLVTSASLIMWHLRASERYVKPAITAASVALALLAEEGRNWEPLLDRHGLTMWDLELVLRMHQLQAIQYFNSEDELSSEEKEEYADLLVTNLLRIVIEEADERGDHQIGSMMRWHLCHSILLGAEGESFQVAKILKLVREARTALEQAASWGADSPPTPAKEPDSYWRCLGFAARCRAAIKADPSYAQSMMDAFQVESDEVLDLEKRHVMCAQCEKLCDKLQRCSACQLVGYCSRNCQVKHWKAGHKQACREHQAPAHREQ